MSDITPQEVGEIYDFAVQLGKDAGRLLMGFAKARWGDTGSGGEQLFSAKDNAVGIVTKADEDVEDFIQSSIEKYPSHKFIGEETHSKGASREYLIGPEPTWCVDPLDGTVNYTHLFPMFCVSIALVVGGEATIDVIYAPFLDQLFSACKGRGAWLNETQRLPLIRNPVPPLPARAPGGCVFSCE
ncbi:inositol monophosphatase [Xylaria acuta]|nr:inositol monophosphatase [Xylaria acuta]